MDENMADYIGMNFLDWCKLDANDNRLIHYTFLGFWRNTNKALCFTSANIMPGTVRRHLANSTIEEIRLENNEWYITTRCND